MPHFSTHSRKELDTCCDSLRLLASTAIRYINFKVVEGYRSNERQNELYNSGDSKAPPGLSKHNQSPSQAIDISTYQVNWKDTDRFIFFAGRILQIADDMGILIRWGGDWNRDTFLQNDSKILDILKFIRSRHRRTPHSSKNFRYAIKWRCAHGPDRNCQIHD